MESPLDGARIDGLVGNVLRQAGEAGVLQVFLDVGDIVVGDGPRPEAGGFPDERPHEHRHARHLIERDASLSAGSARRAMSALATIGSGLPVSLVMQASRQAPPSSGLSGPPFLDLRLLRRPRHPRLAMQHLLGVPLGLRPTRGDDVGVVVLARARDGATSGSGSSNAMTPAASRAASASWAKRCRTRLLLKVREGF